MRASSSHSRYILPARKEAYVHLPLSSILPLFALLETSATTSSETQHTPGTSCSVLKHSAKAQRAAVATTTNITAAFGSV